MAQEKVTGNELVEVVIEKDTKFYKKGDKVTVHAVQAEKWAEKGVIKSSKPKESTVKA